MYSILVIFVELVFCPIAFSHPLLIFQIGRRWLDPGQVQVDVDQRIIHLEIDLSWVPDLTVLILKQIIDLFEIPLMDGVFAAAVDAAQDHHHYTPSDEDYDVPDTRSMSISIIIISQDKIEEIICSKGSQPDLRQNEQTFQPTCRSHISSLFIYHIDHVFDLLP